MAIDPLSVPMYVGSSTRYILSIFLQENNKYEMEKLAVLQVIKSLTKVLQKKV